MNHQPQKTPGTTGVSPQQALGRIVRARSSFLTFEYIVAIGASVITVTLLSAALIMVFSIMNDKLATVGAPLSWFAGVSSGYVGAVWVSLASLITAVVAFICFARVSRALRSRSAYTTRLSYKLTTYVGFAAITGQLLLSVITLVSVFVSSLLLIGSESSIADLYLQVFVPALLATFIAGLASYFMYRIVKGRNVSRLFSLVLVSLASLVVLLAIITVAIKAHDGYTSNDFSRKETTRERSIDNQYYW